MPPARRIRVDDLMDEYLRVTHRLFACIRGGVSCSSSDWRAMDPEEGSRSRICARTRLRFCRICRAYAAKFVQSLRAYNSMRVELKEDADTMFQAVQDYMDESESV